MSIDPKPVSGPLVILNYFTPTKIIALAGAIATAAGGVVLCAQGDWVHGLTMIAAAFGLGGAMHSSGTPNSPRVIPAP